MLFLKGFAEGFVAWFKLILTTDFVYNLGWVIGTTAAVLIPMVVVVAVVCSLLTRQKNNVDEEMRDKITKNVGEYTET